MTTVLYTFPVNPSKRGVRYTHKDYRSCNKFLHGISVTQGAWLYVNLRVVSDIERWYTLLQGTRTCICIMRYTWCRKYLPNVCSIPPFQ